MSPPLPSLPPFLNSLLFDKGGPAWGRSCSLESHSEVLVLWLLRQAIPLQFIAFLISSSSFTRRGKRQKVAASCRSQGRDGIRHSKALLCLLHGPIDNFAEA